MAKANSRFGLCHSFIPSDMIDQIGGWSSGKVGEGYGDGYSITRKKDALLGIVISN